MNTELKTILVDLDGTLINIDHRVPPLKQQPKDWINHRQNYENDEIIPNIATLYRMLYEHYHGWYANFVFLTARMECEREPTEKWLKAHNLAADGIIMRAQDDHRNDDIVKEEVLKKLLAYGHQILFVIEDRQRVVDMWRRNGITCLQPAPGNF